MYSRELPRHDWHKRQRELDLQLLDAEIQNLDEELQNARSEGTYAERVSDVLHLEMLRKDRDFLVASEITRHELHRRRKLDHYRLEFTVNKLRAESIVSALDEDEVTEVSWNQKIDIDETVLYAERLMRAHIRLGEELEWPKLIDRAYKVASLRLADASRAINLYTNEVDQTDGATGLDETHRALLIKLNTAYNDVKLLSRHVSEMVDTDAEVTSLEYPSAPSNKIELLRAERVLLEAEIAAIRQRTVTALFFQIMNEEYLTALQEELDWIEKGVSRYEVRRRGKIEDLRREKVTSLVELKRLESDFDLSDLDEIDRDHHRENIALKNEQLASEIEPYRERVAELGELREAIYISMSDL